jgi:uncharacterized protein YndB with AHSA1/START domain
MAPVSIPTTASASVEIDASAEHVYDLIADVTRMGEWSPECRSCRWLGEPGAVGSRFRGHNRRGVLRWSTTAEVLVADRGREFTFATLHKDDVSTRWSYRLDGDGPTTVTETFEAVTAPAYIHAVERLLMRDRQHELEAGMARTLAAIRSVAEAPPR